MLLWIYILHTEQALENIDSEGKDVSQNASPSSCFSSFLVLSLLSVFRDGL